MKLESARGLKSELLASQVQPLMAMPAKAAALAIAARSLTALDEIPRTIALGIASADHHEYRLAVRVQNQALLEGEEVRAIENAARKEVEIRYIGRLVKRAPWYRMRQRPLLMGASVGHFQITAGTLGCFVATRAGGRIRILSNNHVLADEDAAKKGDAILQQGRFDGGRKGADTIGSFDKAVKLRRTAVNHVDAALATIHAGIRCELGTLRGLGTIHGLAMGPVDVGSIAAKIGRTTGLTHGRITAFELDNVVVAYDRGNLRFDDQIEIEGTGDRPFSEGGDSGSLVVDADGRAIGLLFAGGDQGGSNGKGLTYVNPIATVLDRLGVDLAV